MFKYISFLLKSVFAIIINFLLVSFVSAQTAGASIGVTIPGTQCVEGGTFTAPQLIGCWFSFATYLVSGLAILLIAYGGYKYIMAQGNPDALKEAKEIIYSAIVGIIIMILGYLILNSIGPGIVEPA